MRKYILPVMLLGLFVFSCATAGKLNRVSIGMTKDEVIAAIGKPTSVSAKDGTEYMNYRFSETDSEAYYGIQAQYYVRLINGKVDSYGKRGDFDSTKDPTISIQTDENIKVKSSDELYNELNKLKRLLDDGILTDEEYQSLKKKALEKY